jgi:hypothetical protein
MHTKFYSGNLKERDPLGDVDADGRKTLKLTMKEYCVRMRTGLIWRVAGLYERGN